MSKSISTVHKYTIHSYMKCRHFAIGDSMLQAVSCQRLEIYGTLLSSPVPRVATIVRRDAGSATSPTVQSFAMFHHSLLSIRFAIISNSMCSCHLQMCFLTSTDLRRYAEADAVARLHCVPETDRRQRGETYTDNVPPAGKR